MAKMSLEVKENDLSFQYQLIVSHDACLVQLWRFQLKSVKSYRADKVKFTDRQSLTIVYSTFIQTQIKEDIKAPRHWPLCGKFTGDLWIPRTNGQ